MADLTLSDGREVNFDVSKMTIAEYRGLFSPRESEDVSDATIARVTGMTVEELRALRFDDYAKITGWFLTKAWNKARVPNSASASTTPSSTGD